MKISPPAVIGSQTLVDFPEAGLLQVPAKIDTGADSSAIWASSITKGKDGLSFKLFGPTSPHYTGELIHAKKYSIRSVKNSFGVSEIRYKVPITIKILGRKIKANFTLADRQNNRYPILIGRQTLKHKFVVDVSQKSYGKPTQVLMLVYAGKESTYQQFGRIAEMFGGMVEVDIARYSDLMMVADAEDVRMLVRSSRRDIASYDFVFFLTRTKEADLAAMVATYAKYRGVAFSDQAAIMLPANAKAHQTLVLATRKLSQPRTIYMSTDAWASSFDEVQEHLGLPFVFKDNHGRKGRNNFLIKTKKDFAAKCAYAAQNNLKMIAQTFIPNTGYYRVVVMGGRAVVAMFRHIDTDYSHLFKRDHTGPAEWIDPIDLSSDALYLAIKGTELLLLDVAGVDILQDKNTGVWYCLEVNNSPQLIGGAFVEEKLRALGGFFIREPGR